MPKPHQHEQLFGSEAEKYAQIQKYQDQEKWYAGLQKESEDMVSDFKAKRAELSRRIQELQNLKLEL